MDVSMKDRLAKFLHGEQLWARRSGNLWQDESVIVKQQWLDEADRYIAHLAENSLAIVDSQKMLDFVRKTYPEMLAKELVNI